MIIVLGSFTVEDSQRDKARDISLAHVRRSRLEPGCISHQVCFDAEHTGRLMFVEKWEDMAALQAHFARPESVTFMEHVRALAQGTEAMTLYQASSLS